MLFWRKQIITIPYDRDTNGPWCVGDVNICIEPLETPLQSSLSESAASGVPDAAVLAPPFAGVSFDALTALDVSAIKVWRLKTGLFLGFLALGVLIWDILNAFQAERLVPFGAASLVAIVVAVALSFWIPPLRHRYWGYALRDEELLLVRGIFNRVHTIVPLRRIQHLDISQDSFEREFDLAKLIVHTAGTRSSDVILPGLHQDVAEALRDEMKQFITDQAL